MAVNTTLAPLPGAAPAPVLDTSKATKPSPTEEASKAALAEVETLKAALAAKDAELAKAKPALTLYDQFSQLPKENQHVLLDGLEDLKAGAITRRVGIAEFEDPPQDWRPVSQEVMAAEEPGALTVLAHVFDMVDTFRHVIRALETELKTTQQAVVNLTMLWDNERIQREFGVTPELINRARATGATDLRKFFTEFPPTKKTAATNGHRTQEEVAEAPESDTGEYDPEGMSEEAKNALWAKGRVPSDKRMAQRMREAYGPPGQG
jgi:hypothetical protein